MAAKANSKSCQTSEMELLLALEVNSESCQRSKMELFAKIVKIYKPFTICAKTSILDV